MKKSSTQFNNLAENQPKQIKHPKASTLAFIRKFARVCNEIVPANMRTAVMN